MSKLILIRGLPGSGKSTLARDIVSEDGIHFETDMYWGPNYDFDMSKLGEAHKWCQDSTRKYLTLGSTVVVSNTFTTKKELQPYFDMAKALGIVPHVILCQGIWNNTHNVPEEVLAKMRTRFEYDITDMWS